MGTAHGAIELMRYGASNSTWNFENKLFLLEAEYCFFMNDEKNALEGYAAAVKSARKHRFIHEEGLSNEKAAMFQIHLGNIEAAASHIFEAKRCYERWGAVALVKCMETALSRLADQRKPVSPSFISRSIPKPDAVPFSID